MNDCSVCYSRAIVLQRCRVCKRLVCVACLWAFDAICEDCYQRARVRVREREGE